jgi:hypothetical protein
VVHLHFSVFVKLLAYFRLAEFLAKQTFRNVILTLHRIKHTISIQKQEGMSRGG